LTSTSLDACQSVAREVRRSNQRRTSSCIHHPLP
jgi:hypothetical protein